MPAATVPPISTTRAVNCEPEWLENPPHFSTSGEENAVVVSPLYPHYFPDDTGDGIKCKPLVQVAPMLDVSNTHFRRLCRILSRKCQLWSEMVVDATIINSPELQEHLGFTSIERPIVCQLGGSVVSTMGASTRIIGDWGRGDNEENKYTFSTPDGLRRGGPIYDEININCGCPSPKVSDKGGFGCFLMKEPHTVANVVQRMIRQTNGNIPITVKCRVGVDNNDSYRELKEFIRIVSEKGGARHFIIHARKAWLKGVNPKQNRSLPILKHERVFALVNDFPHLRFSINGGINDLEEVQSLLAKNCKDFELVEDEGIEKLPRNNNSGSNGLNMEGGTIQNLKRTKPDDHVELDDVEVPEKRECSLTTDQWLLKEPSAAECVKDMTSTQDKVAEHPTTLVPSYTLFGVMLGRAILNHPCFLARVDTAIYGEPSDPDTAQTRRTVLKAYGTYLKEEHEKTTEKKKFFLVKPLLGIFYGLPGHKFFRRTIDENCRDKTMTVSDVVFKAIETYDEKFPCIIDYKIGEEPNAGIMKTHMKKSLGIWEYSRTKRQKTDGGEDIPAVVNEIQEQ